MKAILAGMTIIVLSVFIFAQASPAQGLVDGIKKQLQTTIFHAGELAQRGTAVAGPQLHLQHTINCLEGTNGTNFKAAVGHVCQGQGNGIIPDLKAAQAAGVKGADTALKFANIAWTLALQAIKFTDVNEAQPWAKVIAGQLTQASDALGK